METRAERVCGQMIRLVDHFKVVFINLADEHGLTKVQLFALEAMSRHKELAMGKAAEVLHCDASNVTGIVDRLVAQGLLERHECEADRRAKTLRLTDKGQSLVGNLHRELAIRFGCDKFSDDEERFLGKMVDRIVA